MNLLEEIAAHLEFCGFGTVATEEADGNITWGRMPDKPDDCITIYSNNTASAGDVDGARIQIMNRARNTKVAYETSVAIAQELDDFNGFLAGDGSMVRIEIVNSATGLGPDVLKRELYSTNLRVYYCN